MKFDNIKIEKVNREFMILDCCKAIGDLLWSNAQTIAQNRLSQDIYDGMDVELTAEDQEWIKKTIAGRFNFATCDAIAKAMEE